jgi:hypothetical protein
VEQIDNFAIKAINSLLDIDLKHFGNGIISNDIKMLIKKIPHMEPTHIKGFVDKAVYLVRDGVSELDIYIDIEEFIKFLRSHSVDSYYNQKVIKDHENISITEDKKQILIKTEFVIDNLSSTRLANGPLKNVLTIRQMNEGLIRGLALGWKYVKELEKGKTVKDLEKETGQNHRTIQRYINLSYLSPVIVHDIFENKNPENLRLKELLIIASYENFKEQQEIWK